jgi:hypothetical protein
MADALTLWLLAQAQAGKLEPTIAGGPPSFTGVLGQQVFDTKYGLTWWSDGSAWHANGPGLIRARIYQLNSQSVPNGVITGINLDTVNYAGLASMTNSRSDTISVPIAGVYHIDYAVAWSSAVSNRMLISLFQNGADVTHAIDIYAPIGFAGGSDNLQANAGDFFQVIVWQQNGGAVSTSVNPNSHLSVTFVSV